MSDYHDDPRWKSYLNLRNSRPELFVQDQMLEIVFDEQLVDDYVDTAQTPLGLIYQSPYRMLLVDLVRDPDGRLFGYERIVTIEKSGGVVAVPICQDSFILLKQFRHATRETQYAFPRGFAEPGLCEEENMKKEVQEEINMPVNRVSFLGIICPDSGLTSAHVSIWACEVTDFHLNPKKGYEGIEDVLLLNREEMERWILSGRINDAFTLSAWALCQSRNFELFSKISDQF